MRLLRAPRCERCGHPLSERVCAWCALLPPYVRAARSVCWAVRGTGLDIVHALKYGGWRRVAEEMGERMARLDWPADVRAEHPLLVPVPLAPDRERERGYNQSACLARALAARWGDGCRCAEDLLVRTRRTETQTRLTPADRLRNVSGAFSAPQSARNVLRGAHVVLVDDVVTTAATLNACAAALYDAGTRIISFVTFARAPALGDRC
jgi:ComF family protein